MRGIEAEGESVIRTGRKMNNDPTDGSEEVRQLFMKQVPELASGVVQIRGIVRERGFRTMIAVSSTDSAVDPVGSLVGERGIRVKTVVRELWGEKLSGEKIDIIRWSDFLEEFIGNLLAPARASRIVLDAATHRATIYASAEERSVITGPKGTRLRMMSRLVGWELVVADA